MKGFIEQEFNLFFEFETDDRSIVTSASCKLFAEKIAKLVRDNTLIEVKKLLDDRNKKTQRWGAAGARRE